MEQLINALRSKAQTISSLSERFKLSKVAVRDILKDIKLLGYMLVKHGDKYSISKELPVKPVNQVDKEHAFISDKDNSFTFGFLGDTHLGSKYERLDVLNTMYDVFEIEGVTRVYHQGNWVDGECRLNKHDIHTHGIDGQLKYCVDNYPKRKGITTYAITGDDHEGWWAHDQGIDVGSRLEDLMYKEGREDWVCTGYMEAFIPLINVNSRKKQFLLSMHPGGGSAYAMSYKPQKIVESFSGGEKPAVLLIGHYHKLSYNLIRGVHTIQTGCTQDQTVFMRKKGLDAHVGGGICRLSQDPKTGAIYRCRIDYMQYFNKGFYNNRWSYSGPITKPKRSLV